jgi:hypothetical protein
MSVIEINFNFQIYPIIGLMKRFETGYFGGLNLKLIDIFKELYDKVLISRNFNLFPVYVMLKRLRLIY